MPHVLIVAAPTAQRDLLEASLAAAVADVSAADEGTAAMQVVRDLPPRAVLVDAELKGGGVALCRRIKDSPEGASIPCFLLVSAADSKLVLSALEAGVEGLVARTTSPQDLARRIGEAAKAGSRIGTDIDAEYIRRQFPLRGNPDSVLSALAGALARVARLSRDRRAEALARRQAEEALLESEVRLRSVLESALDCIVVIDDAGRIVDFNRAAQEKLAARREEAVGHEFVEKFVPASARERYRKNMAAYTDAGQVGSLLGRRLELPLITAGGEEFLAEVAVQPLPLKGTSGFAVFLRDVTERKRAERKLARFAEELARSNRDLADFANAASHDLQEPLRSVAAFCKLLARRCGEKLDEREREFLAGAQEGTERMQAMISGLLEYSRIETRAKPLERLPISHVVADAVANLEAAIEDASARITYDALPTLPGDRTQLLQLFQNLLANAIKFRGASPPRIRIQAERRGDDWVFAVLDNGIGFDAEHADQVFGLFRRLHAADGYAGTGLGLALCKRIVERHGGRIWVESAPGEGSTFSFSLPAKAPPEK